MAACSPAPAPAPSAPCPAPWVASRRRRCPSLTPSPCSADPRRSRCRRSHRRQARSCRDPACLDPAPPASTTPGTARPDRAAATGALAAAVVGASRNARLRRPTWPVCDARTRERGRSARACARGWRDRPGCRGTRSIRCGPWDAVNYGVRRSVGPARASVLRRVADDCVGRKARPLELTPLVAAAATP